MDNVQMFCVFRLSALRTSRVLSHGDAAKLLKSARNVVDRWEVKQITFAHGTSPFDPARLKELGLKHKKVSAGI